MKPVIIENKEKLNTTELANIAKSCDIAEFDDKELLRILELAVVQNLKKVNTIKIEEIADVVKAYTISRIGSRELYKLLEIIIKHRFEDIRQNDVVLKTIYVHYTKSGLCSPDLLQKIELLI